jgi:Co/Zn/Cd efflux system component
MSGTPVSHEAKGRSPLMFGADASNESARRGNLIRQILSVVLVLNLTVAGAKLGYGFVSGSVAMLADGFHSLLDGFAMSSASSASAWKLDLPTRSTISATDGTKRWPRWRLAR